MLVVDNQASTAVAVKARSSSRALKAVAGHVSAILLCSLNRPLYAYTHTTANQQTQAPGLRMPRRKAPLVKRVTGRPLGDPFAQQGVRTRRVRGTLQQLRAQVGTRECHRGAVTVFTTWLRDMGPSPSTKKELLVQQRCKHIEWLWYKGAHVGWPADALSGFHSISATKTSSLSSSLGAVAFLEA